MQALAKVVCKVVGHEWYSGRCARCLEKRPFLVFKDGILLQPGNDYTETGESTISFSQPPQAGSVISVVVRTPITNRNDFVGDGGSINFTVPS